MTIKKSFEEWGRSPGDGGLFGERETERKMNIILNNSILSVDMKRVRRNVATVLEELQGAQLIPVLKDNAYGLGLEAMGHVMEEFPQITTLAVAQVGEGAALRQAGITREILILGGVPAHLLRAAVELDLTLSVGRLELLPVLALLGQSAGRRVKIQIKIETGLNRTGVMPGAELAHLLEEWRSARNHFQIMGAFSHFADLEDTERTQQQYELFLEGVEQLQAGGMEIPLRHISASAAHEQFPQYRLDGVRIGRRLYLDHPTQPTGRVSETATWRTWITGLRTLQAGSPLGYGGKVFLERDSTVATIAVGYGDGLSEELVRVHGPVLVGGERARLMACCMDQTLVDVTGIPCRVGDPVTLFGWDEQGNLLASQEVALLVGEDEGCGLTAQLSPRVARIYSK